MSQETTSTGVTEPRVPTVTKTLAYNGNCFSAGPDLLALDACKLYSSIHQYNDVTALTRFHNPNTPFNFD